MSQPTAIARPTAGDAPQQPDAETAPKPATMFVRGRQTPTSRARAFIAPTALEAFTAALDWSDCTQAEPVVYWHADTDLTAVDLDWHGDRKPTESQVLDLALRLTPQPAFYWRTHGGGLRLVYTGRHGFPARQFAALAVVSVLTQFQRANCPHPTGVEIKSDTRHPHYPRADGATAGQVHDYCQTFDLVHLARAVLRGERPGDRPDADDEAVAEWLAAEGFQRGGRYPHTRCPIDPAHVTASDAVFIGSESIICHSCRGRDVPYSGMSAPGFAPWSRLLNVVDDRPDGLLGTAVKNMTHWEHAKHVLRHVLSGQSDRVLEEVYRTLLRACHLSQSVPDGVDEDAFADAREKLIGRCFFPSIPVARVANGWFVAPSLDRPAATGKGLGVIEAMPAAHYVGWNPRKCEAESKRDGLKVAKLHGNYDLSDLGYRNLHMLRGVDLAGVIGNPRAFGGAVVPALVACDPPFRYRRPGERDTGMRLSGWFDAVDEDLIHLLIGAKAFSQAGAAEPPRVFLIGQSGAGKSAHAKLAAELTGDTAPEVSADQAAERTRRNIIDVWRADGSYAFLDEFDKSPVCRDPQSTAAVEGLLLGFTPDTKYHEMYKGTGTAGPPGVLLLADTALPAAVRASSQLGRRVILADLGAGVAGRDWLVSSGGIRGFRRRFPDLCDAVVSAAIDRVRPYLEGGTFIQFADSLRFPMLQAGQAGTDLDAPFKELVELLCDDHVAPPWAGGGRWRAGCGWKVFAVHGPDPLADWWREHVGPSATSDAQVLTGYPLYRATEVPGVVCDLLAHGQKVGLRLRLGDARSSAVKYNAACLPPDHPSLRREPGQMAGVVMFPVGGPAGCHDPGVVTVS